MHTYIVCRYGISHYNHFIYTYMHSIIFNNCSVLLYIRIVKSSLNTNEWLVEEKSSEENSANSLCFVQIEHAYTSELAILVFTVV